MSFNGKQMVNYIDCASSRVRKACCDQKLELKSRRKTATDVHSFYEDQEQHNLLYREIFLF